MVKNGSYGRRFVPIGNNPKRRLNLKILQNEFCTISKPTLSWNFQKQKKNPKAAKSRIKKVRHTELTKKYLEKVGIKYVIIQQFISISMPEAIYRFEKSVIKDRGENGFLRGVGEGGGGRKSEKSKLNLIKIL